jgi:hypothetical protein
MLTRRNMASFLFTAAGDVTLTIATLSCGRLFMMIHKSYGSNRDSKVSPAITLGGGSRPSRTLIWHPPQLLRSNRIRQGSPGIDRFRCPSRIAPFGNLMTLFSELAEPKGSYLRVQTRWRARPWSEAS